ncbi:phage integrase SAM-like domain-containing protein, partial [Flavobacteriaceae bacterium]|nr:phage integrase SAM-like domain-containing protein [Flavobacteriaceae bacterium]
NGKKVYLKDLKDNVYVGFIVFLRDKYGLNDNTLYRNFGYFKTFLNWCIKKGVEVPNDFKNIKLSPFDTDDISLTTQDIDTLDNSIEISNLSFTPRELIDTHHIMTLIVKSST